MSESTITRIFSSKLARALAPATAGFFGYGGWGFFCNFRHGIDLGLQSGLIQGSISFFITLVSNAIMESIYKFSKARTFTIAITSFLIIGTSYSVNAIAGTPEILWTIAPGSIMGTIYVITYVSALHRLAQGAEGAEETQA